MSIKEAIEEMMKKAMMEKDDLRLPLSRMLKSVIKNEEIAKGHELDEAETIAVFERQAKQRQDSIEQYMNGGRQDLADHEKAELEIISAFLPEKMSEEEVREVVRKKLADMAGQDFGKVMGALMGELKGKADGGMVQKVVKEEMEA